MIYTLEGTLAAVRDNFAVVEAGGIGFKVYFAPVVRAKLPPVGERMRWHCFLYVRENALDLYGFLSEDELKLFELLNSISGVGPKLALGVLSVSEAKYVRAAIKEGRTELLTKAGGVGKRTAERIILELKNKVEVTDAEETVKKMETDVDLEETLTALGYSKSQARNATEKIPPLAHGFEARLKEALKILKK
ncbi:MAG: Holliday junction branch migration protein RuvA [bacterium]|nr:Holliday junction branch migration protein RuvA [bacterium]